tara:strand:- start:559 stop:912 length:354 start_codon:yes stop_codon:yes gene_type:complete
MPAMQDLLSKLQESPPQTEQELNQLLDDTGYDLVMKQPGMSEDYGEEAPEDMGPEDMGDEDMDAPEEDADELMNLMETLSPPGMGPPGPGDNPRMKVRRMTMVAARKALPKDEEGED